MKPERVKEIAEENCEECQHPNHLGYHVCLDNEAAIKQALEEELTAEQDEIKRLREALEFYADELEWVEYSLLSPVQRDRGKIARQALEVKE